MAIPIFSSPFGLNPLLLLLTGFCVGTMSAFFGIGGGWLVTPAIHILGLPMPHAIGTSLVYIVFTSIAGTIRHRKLKNVSFPAGLIIGLSSIGGIFGGKQLIFFLEKRGSVDTWVRFFYLFLLTAVGIYMLVSKRRGESLKPDIRKGAAIPPFINVPSVPLSRIRRTSDPKVLASGNRLSGAPPVSPSRIRLSVPVLVLVGLAVGLLSSAMGVGGGFVLFPLLIYVVGLPVPLAIGTSLFSVLLTGLQGAAIYIAAQRVDPSGVFYMTITSVIGTYLGSLATKRVDPERIKALFAFTVLGGVIAVLFKQLQFPHLDSIVIFSIAGLSTLVILYTAYIRKHPENRKK